MLRKCSFKPHTHTGQLNLTATEVLSQHLHHLFRPSVAPRAAFAQIPTPFLLQSLMRFMFLGNLIGFPAIVLPTRLGANNLPLSVQVHACATLARPIFTRSLRL